MAGSSDIRAGGAFVELFTKDAALRKGLDNAAKRLKDFGAGVQKVGLQLFGFGAAGVSGMAALTKSFADYGDHIRDASIRTGASTAALSELGFAAEQSGSSLDEVVGAIGKMQRFMVEASAGTGEQAQMLQRLGLSMKFLKGLSPDQQFSAMAEALSRVGNDAQRTDAAMKIFGKGAGTLIPLLREGAGGIEALRKEAAALGITLSQEDADAADAFNDSLNAMKTATRGVANQLGASLAPVLTEIANQIKDAIASTTKWVKENRGLAVTALWVAAGVTAAGAAIIGLGLAISVTGVALAGISSVLGLIGAGIAALLSPLGLTVTALAAAGVAFAAFTENGRASLEWLVAGFDELKTEFTTALGAIGKALAAGEIGLAAKVLWATLKLEWLKGIAFLTEKWATWGSKVKEVAIGAFYGVLMVANNVWAGLQTAWVETVSFMGSAWVGFLTGLKNAWATAQAYVAKGVLHIMKLLDDSIDVDQAKGIIDSDLAKDKAKNNAERDRQKRDIEANRLNRRGGIEADRLGAEQELLKAEQAAQAARRAGDKAAIAQAQADLENARKEWQDAIAAAGAAQGAGGGGPNQKKPPNLDLEQVKASVAGTFSSAALFGLGGGSIQTQQLNELKQLRAQNIRDAERRRNEAAELARIIRTLKGEFG